MKTAVMFGLSCFKLGERIFWILAFPIRSQSRPGFATEILDCSSIPVVIGSRFSIFVLIAPCTTYRYYVMVCDSCNVTHVFRVGNPG